jgi:multidrug efflux pump subunit AcrB
MGDFFVRRPIVAMVIAIFMVIVGVVFLGGLPAEQYPNITPPIVEVRANYTGANAVSVEQSVATPLEQQINGVDNMIYMKSINANDGTMTIQVSFDVGTDPDMNTVFTQNRVAAATAKLPEEVKRLGVTTEKSMPNILMLISLTADDPRFDQQFLGNYSLINIKDILARIKGIGRVNVLGASDYSMRIWIKPDRLAHLGISVPEIVEAIRAQSVVVPGGKFGAEPAPPGTEFTYTVRLPDRLQDEKEFGEIVVRTADNGSQVKIKHIARVELGVESYTAFTRMNDKPCAMIALYQAPGSNAVALAETVKATMADLSRSFPKSMRYDISLDTTLVMVAIFIPVAVMGGITGRLYQQFAITVAVSVVFSSINALTLSPALCGILLRKQQPMRGPLGAFFRLFNLVFDKSTVAYTGFTRIVTRRIAMGLVFMAILTGGLVVLGKLVPGGFMPNEDMGYLMVNIQLPDAASLQRTDRVTKKVEQIIKKHEEVDYITSVAGYSLLSNATSPNAAFVFVSLNDWSLRERTAKAIVAALNREFFVAMNEAQVFAFGPPPIPGLGSGSGFTINIQDRAGNTPEYLAEQTASFIQAARQRPEIGSIMTTFRASVPQRYMEINRDKVLKAGVALNDIYTTVGAFLGGSYVNDFNRFGRLYKAYIQAEPEYRISEDRINLFFVKNKNGDRVPLSAFVSIKAVAGPDYTNRFNLYRSIELTGGPAPGYTSIEALDALEAVAADSLPADMGYAWSNMSFQEKQASGTAAVVFAFSLLFVFLILAAQYESWTLPMSILLGTPFAIFGAFLALYLARMTSTSYELNIFAQIALVMLIGMAAKNAILIVEFANIEFKKGLSLFDAAIKAANSRFRPILMTAFSFILGVLPLVVASGAGAEARVVMGVALLGGMALATMLGVFFYPMLFVFIGKLAGYEKKRDLHKEQG